MAVEIERKFLVNLDKLPPLPEGDEIKQGYISSSEQATVRVRTKGNSAYITIKSATENISRSEYEYPIPLVDAAELLQNLCEQPLIEKKRYLIKHANHTWELDIFSGDNQGLVVAELELSDENEEFETPRWVTEEVSHDARYRNSNLIKHPFKSW